MSNKRPNLFIGASEWRDYADDFSSIVTIDDVTTMYPVSYSMVMYAINHDHLCAAKINGIWLISARSLADWIRKKQIMRPLYS